MYESSFHEIELFWRSANYVSTVLLHLRNNVMLKRPLIEKDFKSVVLGHWGACPGINAIYAQLCGLIKKTNCPVRLIIGTGHAGPSILSNLFLEGTLGNFYSRYERTEAGLRNLALDFATSGGLDTEISAEYPGMIYSGGELGPCLAFSQGCTLMAANSLTVCVLGDGELETSIAQASWQGFRFLSQKTDGKLLPIINANRYKMGSLSLFGTLSKEQKANFFKGHGLYPIFIDANHKKFESKIFEAYKLLQDDFQPVIIFESPKGWTAPKFMGDTPFSGTHYCHKPVIKRPRESSDHMKMIENWIGSYRPKELFDNKGKPFDKVLNCLPETHLLIGKTSLSKSSNNIHVSTSTTTERQTSIGALSKDLATTIKKNKDFLVFSPDELSSNRLVDLLGISCLKFGKEIESNPPLGPNGQIVEILNEHMCHAWIQGYAMSGRRSILISYEAFAPLFDSMTAQHLKFLEKSKGIPWRTDVPSINIVLTSLGWFNCSTHQNPSYVDTLLGRGLENLRVFTPSNPQSVHQAFKVMMESNNGVNVMVLGKYPLPKLAKLYKDFSFEHEPWSIMNEPLIEGAQVTLVAIGDCMVEECLHAKEILEKEYYGVLVQIISIEEATILDRPSDKLNALFKQLSSAVCSVWAYLGYPKTIQSILWRNNLFEGHSVLGYNDKGQKQTSLERFFENGASRFHIALEAIEALAKRDKFYKPDVIRKMVYENIR